MNITQIPKITQGETVRLMYAIESLKEAVKFIQNGYKPDAVDENGKPYNPYFLLGYLEGASTNVLKVAQPIFEK